MSETMTEDYAVGEVADEPVYANYWGSELTEKWYFPDGKQYFEFKIMTEGDRRKYQKLTNQDLKIGRDQTTTVKIDPGEERYHLITQSVVDWYLYAPDQKTGKMGFAKFSRPLLEKWLEMADPRLVEQLETKIRQANPWMLSEQSVADIDKEIDRLVEMRKEKVAMDAGEDVSANK